LVTTAQLRRRPADELTVLAAAALAAATTSYHPVVGAQATACGLVAGSIGVFTSWPQAWRLWVGRRHAGLSLSTNLMGVLYGVAWLLYGFLCHSAVQIATSVAGLAGATAVLIGHLVRARVSPRSWLPWFALGLLVVAVTFAGGRTVLGLTASVATIIGVVPQLLVLTSVSGRSRSGRPGDASGVSRSRWGLSVACNLLWVGYGAIVGDHLILVNSVIIAALASSIVLLATRARPAVGIDAAAPRATATAAS
jgi:uncharacterized protein with PQ loop repeat